nr:immunoglobulin light chain junction region [Macaca mulatta]
DYYCCSYTDSYNFG